MNTLIPTNAINQLIAELHSSPWTTFLVSVSGLGALTMAILQAVKQGLPIRRWFQQYQMVQWLKLHASVARANGFDPCWSRAEEQIVLLSTDGDEGAFYDLEVEKLCGQWNAAIQIAIDSPNTYKDFFLCVSARALKCDIEKVMHSSYDSPPTAGETEPDPEEHQKRLVQRQKCVVERNRVAHQIQRAVDSFQIKTSFRWKWMFQSASFVVSFILAYTAMKILNPSTTADRGATVIWAALAGFLAPVARDLLAGIERLNP